jgi:hypothetical protein
MSQIRAATVSDLAGTGPVTLTGQYAAKAWVNFNGALLLPSIRASENVSSLTDNGTGDYTVNIANDMTNANYGVSVSGNSTTTNNDGRAFSVKSPAAGSFGFRCVASVNSGVVDAELAYGVVWGDLA